MNTHESRDANPEMVRASGALPDGYDGFLSELKQRIQVARVRAVLAVNRELVLLYRSIGRDILERQERDRWGAKVIERIARDLRRAFPDMKGAILS